MKKGTIDIVVIIIIAVITFSVVGTILFKMYQTTTVTKEQFDELITSINNAQDDIVTKEIINLPDGHILVSFASGQDFKGLKGCNYNIKIPKTCGDYPCICMCDGSWKYGYEDACVENGNCVPFADEKITSFYDVDCLSGVFREGTGSPIEFSFKKEGSILRFCNSEECVSQEDQEIASSFSKFVDTYKSCALSEKNDCICSEDMSFLTEGYSINFYSDHVDLYNYKSKNIITSSSMETSPSVLGNNQFTTLISLYRFEEATDEVYTNGLMYYVMSPTLEAINPYSTSTDQTIAQPYFYKNNNIIYFVSQDYSTKESCISTEEKLFV